MGTLTKNFHLKSATHLSHAACPLWIVFDPSQEKCEFNCSYCYVTKSSTSLTSTIQDPELFIKKLAREKRVSMAPIRIGFSTDPFATPDLAEKSVAFIINLNQLKIPYVLMTKSSRVVDYLHLFERNLATIQISITTLNPMLASRYEAGASSPNERLDAIKWIVESGINCVARIDPMISNVTIGPQKITFFTYELIDRLLALNCRQIIFGMLTGVTNSPLVAASIDEITGALDYAKNKGASISYCPLGMKIKESNALNKFQVRNCCHVLGGIQHTPHYHRYRNIGIPNSTAFLKALTLTLVNLLYKKPPT